METNKKLKPHRVGFRLNETEYQKLKSDFKEFGFDRMSDFARYKLLLDINTNENILVSKDLKDEIKQFNYHLNKLGNNINQITKAIYTNNISHQSAIDEVQKNMTFLYNLAKEINNKLK